ncbi:glycosyltransferase family 2 protein [Bythopirellula goksoeyrii]|uniref:Glycosyltransferase 2-like domain-containing protein n=1 Tax=Bythopirellula goksoeyrii TaxID=1400387 RepID=A0A5B9QUD9_9BACT|nr:glycosyltransferase family 2 protein [Bythopirellula goksoeyrii]QEG37681.1 hypothetical protein Pr1d_50270 [Bythopirellula goksoeyrii]
MNSSQAPLPPEEDRLYLSVVAPCYNEESVIEELYKRVTSLCQKHGYSYEIVLVNDGSLDSTWEIHQQLCANDPEHMVAVNLSRNFGHQLALSAGLSVCRGERILIIDADLQDPPELLPDMLRKMDEGAEVVYGVRRTRYGDSFLKRTACTVFYRCLLLLSDYPIPLDSGDFRLINRRVLDALNSMPERHRFLRGMISWIGYNQVPIHYDRDSRFAGETKYPLRRLIALAIDGITTFSVKPLRLSFISGLGALLFSLLLFIYAIISWYFFPDAPRGWASLMVVVSMLGGMQLFVLGILGEYLGRVYEQSKSRPLFLIESIKRDSMQ